MFPGSWAIVTAVTATISNFGHTYPGYVDMVLEGPGGQDTFLMYGCGGECRCNTLT